LLSPPSSGNTCPRATPGPIPHTQGDPRPGGTLQPALRGSRGCISPSPPLFRVDMRPYGGRRGGAIGIPLCSPLWWHGIPLPVPPGSLYTQCSLDPSLHISPPYPSPRSNSRPPRGACPTSHPRPYIARCTRPRKEAQASHWKRHSGCPHRCKLFPEPPSPSPRRPWRGGSRHLSVKTAQRWWVVGVFLPRQFCQKSTLPCWLLFRLACRGQSRLASLEWYAIWLLRFGLERQIIGPLRDLLLGWENARLHRPVFTDDTMEEAAVAHHCHLYCCGGHFADVVASLQLLLAV
jgi:hypothetical protein